MAEGRLGWGIVTVSHDGKLGERPPPRGAQHGKPVARQPDRPSRIEERRQLGALQAARALPQTEVQVA